MLGTTDSFNVKAGLQKGSAISPFLFDVVMDCFTVELQKPVPWHITFADDVALNGETMRKLAKGWSNGGVQLKIDE